MDPEPQSERPDFGSACIVTVFDHDGVVTETVEVARAEAARRIARVASRKLEIAYATVRTFERTDVFARGKGRLRITRPK
ncbi:MAG: hypothetical protein JWL76_2291 [Thermoleophilia bacterium]|nr:hypothetical protein [Thermoleophilia bacterium]